MKTNYSIITKKLIKHFTLGMFMIFQYALAAQTLTYQIKNNSHLPDNRVYVAIVGIKGGHVWVDPLTGQVNPMSVSDNTIPGPVIDGNQGPGNNGLYANCFRKLSDIPNKTINIPKIEGCRIMISFNSQLYLYFFGHSGAPSGYAAPNLANPTDPNQGIKFELIELTYNDIGLWCNTSRVDSYQYPMGLEVWGDNFYKKVGELKNHNDILEQWQASAPTEFKSLLNTSEGIIHFPTKVETFPKNFMDSYIDNIWNKYTTQELAFTSDAGIWRGRVQSGNQFVFYRDSDGQVATIPGKPTTIEAMEGSGIMASGERWDLVVQSQMVAAITRHAVDLNVPSGVLQNFGDASKYYQTWPYNWYSKFFHQTDISFESQTYTFAYDDVYDQSATIHTPNPRNIKITIGGFAGTNSFPDPGKWYVLKNKDSRLNMRNEDCGTALETKVELFHGTGDCSQWRFIDNNGVWTIQNRNSGLNLRHDSEVVINDQTLAELINTNGNKTYFKVVSSPEAAYYHIRHVGSGLNLRNVDCQDVNDQTRIEFSNTTEDCARWQFIEAGNIGSSFSQAIEAENSVVQSGTQTEACSEGGLNVGWIDTGDWLVWDINIPANGSYIVEYRVASPNSNGRIQLEQAGGVPIFGTRSVPNTGNWQNWATVSHTVNFNAGQQQIAIKALTGGWNINWLKISNSNSPLEIPKSNNNSKESKQQLMIYPNPFTDQIKLKFDGKNAKITIFDVSGHKALPSTKIQSNRSIRLSGLSKGLYLIKIDMDGEIITKQLIKD